MSVRDVTFRIQRTGLAVCSTVIAVGLMGIAGNAAMAQSVHEFSSSADGMTSSTAEAVSLAAAPAPVVAQSDNSYGRRSGRFDRLAFVAGGGVNAPTPDSSPYITWGGNLTVGAGYKITSYLSLLTEYQFIDDKLPGAIISETGANGGNAHIWSLTMAPVVSLFPKKKNDIYITGGGGFYRKVTNFTDPVAVQYCNYYYCGIGYQNQVVGHFSSNQGGWNVGVGYSHRLGGMYGDSRMKLFAEARYLDVLSPAVVSEPNGLGTTTVGADTKLIPVTFGVRF